MIQQFLPNIGKFSQIAENFPKSRKILPNGESEDFLEKIEPENSGNSIQLIFKRTKQSKKIKKLIWNTFPKINDLEIVNFI